MSVSYDEMDEFYASCRKPAEKCILLNPECRTCVDPVCQRRDEDEQEEGGDDE